MNTRNIPTRIAVVPDESAVLNDGQLFIPGMRECMSAKEECQKAIHCWRLEFQRDT
jgi:hypothetical protein